MPAELLVVNYHYVRDTRDRRLPPPSAITVDAFLSQVDELAASCEMATLAAATSFLAGQYHPARTLCLLTFDDALREHYETVLPILLERSIQGVFFVQTASLAGEIADVHKTHLLQGSCGPERLAALVGCWADEHGYAFTADAPPGEALRVYPFDTTATAAMKHFINFRLPADRRSALLADLLAEHVAPEAADSRALYMTWEEVLELQRAGMSVGGHSHSHLALGTYPAVVQHRDIARCAAELRAHLAVQPLWAFSYPNGSYGAETPALVASLGFHCAFTTEFGANGAGTNPFAVRRVDTTEIQDGRCRPRGRRSFAGATPAPCNDQQPGEVYMPDGAAH